MLFATFCSRHGRVRFPVNAVKQPIKRSFVFFLVPDFTMIAFATALDPLRSANRMLGYEAYRWRLASIDGKPVRASNGVECAVNTSLDEERKKMAGPDRPNMAIVCSGINVERYQNKSAFAWLREAIVTAAPAFANACAAARPMPELPPMTNTR